MRRMSLTLFLVALASLAVELLLTKVFDVILWPNLSFLVISCAIFGLGLGGLVEVVRPSSEGHPKLAAPALGFAASVWAIPFLLNVIPFSLYGIASHPIAQLCWFLLLYLVVLTPFFCVGLCVCRIFASAAREVPRLYFWDLSGAAIGAAAVMPLVQPFGPERLLVGASLLAAAAAALSAPTRRWRAVAATAGLAFAILPALIGQRYLTIVLHDDKRGTASDTALGALEFSTWDPVSHISVLDEPRRTDLPSDRGRKHIAYDGGTQTSNFFPFDGNFEALRRDLPAQIMSQFWQRGVLAVHYLNRDRGERALIIGSAGGQETKAALLYGARDVEAVEMVGTVVHLGTGRYAGYIGHIFENPAVHVHVGEGRSFVRASSTRFDAIQIFSNYTSSSIAEGSGALVPSYLLTTEAFRDYFAHLSEDGVIQINHTFYPRIITTAAAAWGALGRTDFRRHVLVFEKRPPIADYLPTVLIKMSPWTEAEVADLTGFFSFKAPGETPYALAEDPLHADRSFLPDGFYAATLPPALVHAAPYDIRPATDDHPFFRFARTSLRRLDADRATGLDRSTAWALNAQLHGGWLPREWLHLIGAAAASIFYGMLFVLAPLGLSRVGRERWSGKLPTLAYFSLLGFGFITIELVLIQVFMKVIGYPLYAVATVITVMLVAAALGSKASTRLTAGGTRWSVTFAGVIGCGLLLILVVPSLGRIALTAAMPVRIAATALAIAPLAFFMGMPFPLGILELRSKPRGAIAWAWSMNGLFTTAGAVLSAVLALWIGFRGTLAVAFLAYVVAAAMLALLRRSNRESPRQQRAGLAEVA